MPVVVPPAATYCSPPDDTVMLVADAPASTIWSPPLNVVPPLAEP
jgi:hypothetical protein